MGGPGSFSLALQADQTNELFTIELLDEQGARVFGIEAYLGAPEPANLR